MTESNFPPQHVIQLTDVWLQRATTRRRSCREGDAPRPSLHISRLRFRGMRPDHDAFGCSIEVNISVPVLDDELFTASLEIAATFAAQNKLSTAVARDFCHKQSLYLLWPFARGYFHQLAQAAGVTVPPLPLIVRPSMPMVDQAPAADS